MKTKLISVSRGICHAFAAQLPLSAAVLATLLAASLSLPAQVLPVSFEYLPYQLESGLHDNDSAEEEAPFSALIEITNTPILRVHFNSYNLGTRSYLTLISVKDKGMQRLDSKTMPQWQGTSALFNGPGVLVQLHVAPGEKGIFANVDQIVLNAGCGDVKSAPRLAGLIETLCGADSRVASTDFRVGRISGCTAWLVSNGAVLTAGHCSPVGGVFEVNVPASTASGGQVAAAPEDQYPVDTVNATFINNGQGDDWTVFGLQPNSNTGGRAHVQHSFFRMSRETPANGSTVRVTGYGVDNTPAGPVANCCAFDSSSNCTHPRCNAQSRTLQTATGPYLGESIGGANNAQHFYSTDTEPANSGSPIIWSANGFAIGIHTNGGCNSDGSGSNSGTSFENNGLENALQNFPGANTRYVDVETVIYPNSPARNGTIFQPFSNLPAAVAAVPSGGRISLVEGSYPKANNTGVFGTGNKAMTLIAPVGTVTIGN